MSSIYQVIYLLAYILTIIYLVVIGCYMLMHHDHQSSTPGELIAKRRMTFTLGVSMHVWALDLFLYLPPMLLHYQPDDPIYSLLFIITLALTTPLYYIVMYTLMQRRFNLWRIIVLIGSPFLLLIFWHIIDPLQKAPAFVASAIEIILIAILLILHTREYRIYKHRVKTEYSEMTDRDLHWSYATLYGFAAQSILFLMYQLMWTPLHEIIYFALSLINITALCFCTCTHKTIDDNDNDGGDDNDDDGDDNDNYNYVLNASIEQKLKSHCEDSLLFLNPELSLDMLCKCLAINRTYLGMYFRKRGISFYRYINTLRVEYAYKLMCDSPELSIREVSEQSGFRTQTTFRKMFREVKGCLPSEVKTTLSSDSTNHKT